MKTRIRLLPLVLVCVGALILLSAGTIAVVNHLTTRTIFAELSGQVVARSLGGMEIALRKHLDAAAHLADFHANAIASGAVSLGEHARLADFAAGSLAAAPQITGLVIADADGAALSVTRAADGTAHAAWHGVLDDPHLAEAAKQMRGERETRWAPPIYIDALGTTLFNLHVPVWRDDRYLGFVGVGISVQALSELALELSDPPRSRVFVLYGGDRVLAHMFMVLQPGSLSAEKPLLGTDDVIDPVIAGLDEAVPFRPAGFAPAGDVELRGVEVGGAHHIVLSQAITGYTDLPLEIGAYMDSSPVEALLLAIYGAAFIGALVLCLGLVLAFAFSRTITRPIRETAERAAAIADLDFERTEPMPPSRVREIDDLARSFNAMLVGLGAFGRYVPRALVRRLIRENRIGAGTETRDLTVMFTDIVEFTTTCEGMTPEEVAAFVNHHLTLVSTCVEREGGTIDKFIGDAVMAFWGAPDVIEDAPRRAGRAALAIEQAIAADNARRTAAGLSRVRMRIGIHAGPLIVGDIGTPDRINYTVIGDVANAAQRLEALGKEVDPHAETITLVSSAVAEGIGDALTAIAVGSYQVKGKREPLEVYRLAAVPAPPEAGVTPR